MSSYQLSQEVNFQSVLWTIAGATWRLGHTARQVSQAGLHACLWVYTMLLTLWPDVAALVAVTAKATAVVLAIVGIVGAVALVMSNPMFLVGLTLTAGYGFVFYPQKAVRK